MRNKNPNRKIILKKIVVNNEEDMPFIVKKELLSTTAFIANATVAQLAAAQAAGALNGGVVGGIGAVVVESSIGVLGVGVTSAVGSVAFPVLLAIPAWIGVAYGTKKYLTRRRIKKVAKEIGQKIVNNKEIIESIAIYMSTAGGIIGITLPEIAIPVAIPLIVAPALADLLIKLGKKLSDIEIENVGKQLSLIA